MSSTEALAISSLVLGAILLLAILAVIVWLSRQQHQSTREQQTFLASFVTQSMTSLSESQRLQLEAVRTSAESMMERLSSQLSSAQTQFLQHQQVQTQELAVAMSTSVNQATSSVSSTAKQLGELLASAQAMNATKDPIAFQQVRGAAFPFASESGAEPYTSTEDLAYQDAENAAREQSLRTVDQSLSTIMSFAGVTNDEPYPTAGSGTGLWPAAPAE